MNVQVTIRMTLVYLSTSCHPKRCLLFAKLLTEAIRPSPHLVTVISKPYNPEYLDKLSLIKFSLYRTRNSFRLRLHSLEFEIFNSDYLFKSSIYIENKYKHLHRCRPLQNYTSLPLMSSRPHGSWVILWRLYMFQKT